MHKLFEIKNRISVAFIYAIAASIFIIYVGVIAILRYKTYRNPNFDFGIWSQMFYYMKNPLHHLQPVKDRI